MRYELGMKMRDYIAAKYGASVLAELSDPQLQQVYQTIARWSYAVQMAIERRFDFSRSSQIR
ncbi:MAG: hypothetical protein ABI843_02460 [Dokdonella sp.]